MAKMNGYQNRIRLMNCSLYIPSPKPSDENNTVDVKNNISDERLFFRSCVKNRIIVFSTIPLAKNILDKIFHRVFNI